MICIIYPSQFIGIKKARYINELLNKHLNSFYSKLIDIISDTEFPDSSSTTTVNI